MTLNLYGKLSAKVRGLVPGNQLCILAQVRSLAQFTHAKRHAANTTTECFTDILFPENYNTTFNLRYNHNYIKILESDCSSTALISALIVQLHTSCTCNNFVKLYASCLSNWTVLLIKLALVALEWVLFQHLSQKLNSSTCQILYTTVRFFSNFVIVMINY